MSELTLRDEEPELLQTLDRLVEIHGTATIREALELIEKEACGE